MSAFANAANKLGAAPKKSIFDKQKDEAEAKKARDEAETAAAYEDFVKSFEGDGPAPTQNPRPGGSSTGSHGLGKRHFTGSGLKSGPGSLGPPPSGPRSGPGGFGPAFGKKRQYEDFAGRRDRDRETDFDRMFAYDQRRDTLDRERVSHDGEEHKDEEDKAAARPTLHLSSLPPGTSPAVIKALFTSSPLVVENVRILSGSSADRRAISSIVTLAAETPSSDIDTMVSHLQNKYLGFGFNLSISRHLSSAAIGGANAINAPGATANSLPFGARPIVQQTSLSRAPPPGQPGRFAPPTSYTSSTPYGPKSQSQVIVQTPTDLRQLKLIHKTLEALLTHGPGFEALLMSRPQTQRDPQWAWLWNPRSQGGIYYRWRLWEVLTRSESRRSQRTGYGTKPPAELLFEGQSQWIAPEETLKFEYTTRLAEFVSDEDYNSSDEEDDDEVGGGLARRHNDHNQDAATQANAADTNDGLGYLNPLSKAKLVHLLTRLPDSNAKLRKGDVARITAFAIEHAGAGADEVAQLVTRNVIQPFNTRNQARSDNEKSTSEEDEAPQPTSDKKDPSPSSLVGLYIISDILSASASAGVRHAWRYRSLFESALRKQKIFERLGRYEKDMNWGKLKAEKWKRSVQIVLGLWEGWCVWTGEVHQEFERMFLEPPVRESEKEEREKSSQEKDNNTRFKKGEKWKSVDAATDDQASPDDVDGTMMMMMMDDEEGDVDGMPLDEDDAIDEDVDGVPMTDSSDEDMVDVVEEQSVPEDVPPPPSPPPLEHKPEPPPPTSIGRQRPRAVDMFADDSD